MKQGLELWMKMIGLQQHVPLLKEETRVERMSLSDLVDDSGDEEEHGRNHHCCGW